MSSSDSYRPWIIGGSALLAASLHWIFSRHQRTNSTQLSEALRTSSCNFGYEKSNVETMKCIDQSQRNLEQDDTHTIVTVGHSVGPIVEVENSVIDSGKWLRLRNKTYYHTGIGTETETNSPIPKAVHQWEYIERTTTITTHDTGNNIDGVDIVGIVHHKGIPTHLVLIANVRPPVGKGVIEFPAGLIDANETVDQAAIRELKEETGFVGTVESTSIISCVDPWKSTENCVRVFMAIDGDDERNQVLQHDRDGEENIQVLLVPIDDIGRGLSIIQKEFGYEIESKVLAFAQGQRLGLTLNAVRQQAKQDNDTTVLGRL